MRLLILILVLLAGCTDAELASFGSYGSPGDVTCYSGGRVVYQGRSTGKIVTMHQSDGWQFKDAANGRLVRVSGDCVITN